MTGVALQCPSDSACRRVRGHAVADRAAHGAGGLSTDTAQFVRRDELEEIIAFHNEGLLKLSI